MIYGAVTLTRPFLFLLAQVYQLGGIPLLVNLLCRTNPAVSQASAGALRNLVFKDHNNKLEVQHCGGIAKALQLLKDTDSTETQKQITGRMSKMLNHLYPRKTNIDAALFRGISYILCVNNIHILLDVNFFLFLLQVVSVACDSHIGPFSCHIKKENQK